ncbi:MAG TPA: HNH endonuclease [Saprospiraceae bacterium]|nr:HNH endonuclease [Saprospiraceae bacterium]
MSYEGEMLKKLLMPTKKDVEQALLKTLFKHNGTIKEFAAGEDIVNELADVFSLSEEQRTVALERIYRKENRIVKTPLWHRLLYRAADSLAKQQLILRPTETFELTQRKEWMLTEDGFDKSLKLLNVAFDAQETLRVKSSEVQKLVNKVKTTQHPETYDPFEIQSRKKIVSREQSIRSRCFRHVVLESYDCKCSVCGLKINSPDNMHWEVEAAHIVPHGKNGKDEIWNGIALCRLHHWAFDVGWFSLTEDYRVIVSGKYRNIPDHYGKVGNIDFLTHVLVPNTPIILPEIASLKPHHSAIQWHRENVYYK